VTEDGPASASVQLLLDNKAAADHNRRTDNRSLFRVGKGRTAAVSIPAAPGTGVFCLPME